MRLFITASSPRTVSTTNLSLFNFSTDFSEQPERVCTLRYSQTIVSACFKSINAKAAVMASLPSSHYDGNADDPSWLLLHGSPVSSDLDLGSFKSLKSSADFLHNPLILEFNGGTDSFTVSRFPKSSRKRKYGSDSITHGATLGLNSSPNQYSLFVPQVEVRQHPPPKPTLSESSFYSFNSAPDNSKSRANLFMDHTNLLDRPPTTTMPFDSIFEPTVDKSLLEPQHPPTLDGYVQMDSTSNLTTLPGSNSTQKLEIPNPGDHLLDHSPSTRTPTSQAHRNVPNSPRHSLGSASQSGSDCFMTAPTSLESNSSDSFETAPTSIPANKSSVNILEPQLHPTNGNIDKRKPPALKLPNWTLVNNLPPNLFRHRWTIFANHKASAFNRPESQRSVESLFLPHPRAKKPPPRKDPVHDGSFLTPAIHTAVNEAFTLFEAAQQSRALSRPRVSFLRPTICFYLINQIIFRHHQILFLCTRPRL